LHTDVASVNTFWRVAALVLAAAMLVMSNSARAASDPGKPCSGDASKPAPAYPLPAYTARDIAAMFEPPRTVANLLSNLKIVLDRQLLAQPAFFDDEVLRRVFNAIDVQWVRPGAAGAVSDRLVKPTRIAHVRLDEGGSFAGINVYAGVNHKCLDRRPHPLRTDAVIPAHTYDSGYLFIQVDGPIAITVDDVRGAFGSTYVAFERNCHSPLPMNYAGPAGPSRDAFLLHSADFFPSWVRYEELCRAAPERGLPGAHSISYAWIRLVEQDYTSPTAPTP